MIKVTLRSPVCPQDVLKATGKKCYLSKNSYCMNVNTVGELETTTNLLNATGIELQSWEDIKSV
jgi:hypothetical protein